MADESTKLRIELKATKEKIGQIENEFRRQVDSSRNEVVELQEKIKKL